MGMNFKETGDNGIESAMGLIQEAYNSKLTWPSCYPLFNRIRRSDPEVSIVRQTFVSLARSVSFNVEMPEKPSGDDQRAADFVYSVLDDMAGGVDEFIETLVSYVPFFGWGWWEAVPGRRDPNWKPPGNDKWRSQYSDGLIGYRRLAFRNASTFRKWNLDEHGRVEALVQQKFGGKEIVLPIENSLHITFGDPNNPEGLSPLEAIWRLERVKYSLEVVQGIGFEHSAGHLSVKFDGELTPQDKANIAQAAKAIMAAQEGNYAAWPKKVISADIIDSPFSAAPSLLEAIRYYGIIKLMVYSAQWMALSSVSGSGSFAAMSDSSGMFLSYFNAMMEGFTKQVDDQVIRRLFEYNAGAFPGMTSRPRLVAVPISKSINLSEIAGLSAAWETIRTMNEEDQAAFRRAIGFVPETVEVAEPAPDEPKPPKQQQQEPEEMSLQKRRPFVVDDDEYPDPDDSPIVITDDELAASIKRLERQNKKNPKLKLDKFLSFLNATEADDESD